VARFPPTASSTPPHGIPARRQGSVPRACLALDGAPKRRGALRRAAVKGMSPPPSTVSLSGHASSWLRGSPAFSMHRGCNTFRAAISVRHSDSGSGRTRPLTPSDAPSTHTRAAGSAIASCYSTRCIGGAGEPASVTHSFCLPWQENGPRRVKLTPYTGALVAEILPMGTGRIRNQSNDEVCTMA
jgi:hypothetical protein